MTTETRFLPLALARLAIRRPRDTSILAECYCR